jgi:hypothetical protein
VRRDRHRQALGRPDRDDQPEVSHFPETKGAAEQSAAPFSFVVVLNESGLAAGAADAIRRNDHRNILAGAMAGLGPPSPSGGMEWFSFASH